VDSGEKLFLFNGFRPLGPGKKLIRRDLLTEILHSILYGVDWFFAAPGTADDPFKMVELKGSRRLFFFTLCSNFIKLDGFTRQSQRGF
jgi:hypothetical protein